SFIGRSELKGVLSNATPSRSYYRSGKRRVVVDGIGYLQKIEKIVEQSPFSLILEKAYYSSQGNGRCFSELIAVAEDASLKEGPWKRQRSEVFTSHSVSAIQYFLVWASHCFMFIALFILSVGSASKLLKLHRLPEEEDLARYMSFPTGEGRRLCGANIVFMEIEAQSHFYPCPVEESKRRGLCDR
ncbi:hypothetical protein ACJX0J_025221, partial [Zea mays]